MVEDCARVFFADLDAEVHQRLLETGEIHRLLHTGHVYVRGHVYVYLYVHLYVRVHLYAYVYAHVYVYVHASMYVSLIMHTPDKN